MKTCLLALALLHFLLAVAPGAAPLSDDFNDGDDAGWTRYDPIGSHPDLPDLGDFSFPNGAYRIRSAPSPAPSLVGPGRVGSFRADITYTNFYITVDVLDWDDTQVQSFGILARIREVGLGSTDGYAMTFNLTHDDVDITRFANENTSGGNIPLSGDEDAVLVKGQAYRFVFMGKGSELTAQIIELPGGTNMIVNATGSDSTYPDGLTGLLVYDNSSNESGTADVTFDNWFALDAIPPRLNVTLNAWETVVTWPTDAEGFKLQAAPAITGPWTDVPPEMIWPSAVWQEYREESLTGTQFFRLLRP